MQIYTDGSKDEQNSCGSGIFIKAPNCSHNIKIRNSDFCSVFRSELIAIDEALRIIKTMTSPDEIWILCDSRSAIQHLSDWTNVGDKTSVSILKNLKELSQQHEIYFQWIPSHIGLFGNDTADLLAKEGVTEDLMSRRTLTFSEIFSKTKSLIQELWKTPPTHPWYNRQAPGGALSIKADRVVQTTISRLASGHIRGLSFHLGKKIYENCTKCNLVQATPDHLLFCAGLDREDIYSSPLLVYDFLRTLGLMDLVNINPASQAPELEYSLRKVDCTALVTWDVLKTQVFYDILCQIIPDLPKKDRYKLKTSNFPNLKAVIMISEDKKDGILNFNEVLDFGNKESDETLYEVEKTIQFDDPVNIQYTSQKIGFVLCCMKMEKQVVVLEKESWSIAGVGNLRIGPRYNSQLHSALLNKFVNF
ncbi:medium-chain acyl-CoA ligase ACSF2, mitochondrial [Trichonephila clavipes]|nr:medium-chain acyl-CoA ligase ACSF2, mitochondrial [Trichonephila clavipes]